ncbi:uncharacterized protein YALI1_C17307g [Yarrowia lipolytica]|uniref:Uncharacterized protein n=1 Tax=Yarrowia lipolytica TaxID=4952 RepID=A0A1D8NAT8_YARLL|nr:hypothetical protein YALI1_C17307g [Yarrowia lipolytica]
MTSSVRRQSDVKVTFDNDVGQSSTVSCASGVVISLLNRRKRSRGLFIRGIDRYCRQSLRYCFQAVHTVPKLQLAKAALGESLSFTNLLLVLVDIMPLTMGC